MFGKNDKENELRKITEEKRKEFEWMAVIVWDPKYYMHIVGFFWWTSWRNNQELIREIRNMFADKVKQFKL